MGVGDAEVARVGEGTSVLAHPIGQRDETLDGPAARGGLRQFGRRRQGDRRQGDRRLREGAFLADAAVHDAVLHDLLEHLLVVRHASGVEIALEPFERPRNGEIDAVVESRVRPERGQPAQRGIVERRRVRGSQPQR